MTETAEKVSTAELYGVIKKRMGFYDRMRNIAYSLISSYGDKFMLKKPDGNAVFNPDTNRNEQHFSEYPGKCLMKPYTAEMIGSLNNIIKAGDVEFKCVMDDMSVTPTEGKDKVVFGGDTYNILSVSMVKPNGKNVIVHSLQARRATK